jgi:hypothetical protein
VACLAAVDPNDKIKSLVVEQRRLCRLRESPEVAQAVIAWFACADILCKSLPVDKQALVQKLSAELADAFPTLAEESL